MIEPYSLSHNADIYVFSSYSCHVFKTKTFFLNSISFERLLHYILDLKSKLRNDFSTNRDHFLR